MQSKRNFKLNLDININSDIDFKNIDKNNFTLTKKLTKSYEYHSYKINIDIKNDILNNNITTDK